MSSNNSRKMLLSGRNTAPLTDQEIKRAANIFLGLDGLVNTRYEISSNTRFIVNIENPNEEYGEIIFSEDLYPGGNIGNPNASVTLNGAAAHELAHFHRWTNKTELEHGYLTDLDEAMTSLEAVLRYASKLDTTDIQGLISDSLYRLRLFVEGQKK